MKAMGNPLCPICGKVRGGHIDHTRCSKILQKMREDGPKKNNVPRYTKKVVDYFSRIK